MVATRAKAKNDTIQFWLPDPADIDRLIQLLEIYGYTDESIAREEASELEACGEDGAVFEVTVRRREAANSHQWHEETNWYKDLREGVWQA